MSIELITTEINPVEQLVAMEVLYNGRSVTKYRVGDPLIFSLIFLQGSRSITDMIAFNVIAEDPFSKREIVLINSQGFVNRLMSIF